MQVAGGGFLSRCVGNALNFFDMLRDTCWDFTPSVARLSSCI